MQVVSVVRDFDMYERLVRSNVHMQGAVFTPYDNREENLHITTRYNQFLDSYDYAKEDWFVFCHEDWEVKEDLVARLEGLDKNCLYGPVGVTLIACEGGARTLGQIIESKKDGSNPHTAGISVKINEEVGTFDCQCLILHSSVIARHNLRFDENLSFDLYVEDFCIQAREHASIKSYILQLHCQHYSGGNVAERFYQQYDYICSKYAKSKYFYGTTVNGLFLGDKARLSKVLSMKKMLVHVHLYYTDMWPELKSYLENMEGYEYDLYVTIVQENEELEKDILAFKADAKIVIVENRGFDIRPFVQIMQNCNLDDYSYVVKLHSKRDLKVAHLGCFLFYGKEWREEACVFLRTQDNFRKAIQALDQQDKVVMCSSHMVTIRSSCDEDDRVANERFTEILNNNNLKAIPYSFVGGSMFVACAKIFDLLNYIDLDEFEYEVKHNGQFAHAIERFLGYCAYIHGGIIRDPITTKQQRYYKIIFRNFMFYKMRCFFFRYERNKAGRMRLKICKIPIPIDLFSKKK